MKCYQLNLWFIAKKRNRCTGSLQDLRKAPEHLGSARKRRSRAPVSWEIGAGYQSIIRPCLDSNERPEVECVEHEIDGILELPKK